MSQPSGPPVREGSNDPSFSGQRAPNNANPSPRIPGPPQQFLGPQQHQHQQHQPFMQQQQQHQQFQQQIPGNLHQYGSSSSHQPAQYWNDGMQQQSRIITTTAPNTYYNPSNPITLPLLPPASTLPPRIVTNYAGHQHVSYMTSSPILSPPSTYADLPPLPPPVIPFEQQQQQQPLPQHHQLPPLLPLPPQHHYQPPPPILVNPKQYSRILKRRESRARSLQARSPSIISTTSSGSSGSDHSTSVSAPVDGWNSGVGGNTRRGRKRQYIHQSRHEQAMRRVRGPGGRFLSKKELEELRAKEAEEEEKDG